MFKLFDSSCEEQVYVQSLWLSWGQAHTQTGREEHVGAKCCCLLLCRLEECTWRGIGMEMETTGLVWCRMTADGVHRGVP